MLWLLLALDLFDWSLIIALPCQSLGPSLTGLCETCLIWNRVGLLVCGLQLIRITLWASTNWPSSQAKVTSVNSLARLTRWSWLAPVHPLRTFGKETNTLIPWYTWEKSLMIRRSQRCWPIREVGRVFSATHFFEHFFGRFNSNEPFFERTTQT